MYNIYMKIALSRTFFAAPLEPSLTEHRHDNCHLQEPGDQGHPRQEGEVGVGVHHRRAALAVATVIVRASLYEICQSHEDGDSLIFSPWLCRLE